MYLNAEQVVLEAEKYEDAMNSLEGVKALVFSDRVFIIDEDLTPTHIDQLYKWRRNTNSPNDTHGHRVEYWHFVDRNGKVAPGRSKPYLKSTVHDGDYVSTWYVPLVEMEDYSVITTHNFHQFTTVKRGVKEMSPEGEVVAQIEVWR